MNSSEPQYQKTVLMLNSLMSGALRGVSTTATRDAKGLVMLSVCTQELLQISDEERSQLTGTVADEQRRRLRDARMGLPEEQAVFVTTNDRGRCLPGKMGSLSEDVLGNCTVLMFEPAEYYAGRHSYPCFRAERDILIPPPVGGSILDLEVQNVEEEVRAWGAEQDKGEKRALLAHFRGFDPEENCNRLADQMRCRISNHHSLSTRGLLLAMFGGGRNRPALRYNSLRLPSVANGSIIVSSTRVEQKNMYSEMRSSVFCLCPPGFGQWTQRFYEAVRLGCLPVTFEDLGYASPWPFERRVRYADFVINVPPRDMGGLLYRLAAIAADRPQLRALRYAMLRARLAFDWQDHSEHGALKHIIGELRTRARAMHGAMRPSVP